MNLLKELVRASLKAANIARKCRNNEHLFELLVQEKSEAESNPRFVHDFKTLADVLIQETIRHDIGKVFPEMSEHICGEESAKFTNCLGETIDVNVMSNQNETAHLLEKVLDGDKDAADALAEEVHRDISEDEVLGAIPQLEDFFDYADLGIWIDPIDGTSEYIKGQTEESDYAGIFRSGLQCCTILIGVYRLSSGVPMMGVVNSIFENENMGKVYWGVCTERTSLNNIPMRSERKNKIALVSSSESSSHVRFLIDRGFEVVSAAGAGYKLLKVITGEADMYFLSKGTSFKWDTCGPHAILRSLDGCLMKLTEAIGDGSKEEISYESSSDVCNASGIIALRNEELFDLMVVMKLNK